jgi:IS1 family transposase
MNKLDRKTRIQILACLTEGNSIRSTARITGTSKNTVVRLLKEVGAVCQEYHDRFVRKLTCKKIECDEIWSFCYAKKKNVPERMKGEFGVGDVWTWVAIDAKTKLTITWLIGHRNTAWAKAFMWDVATRLTNRVQLTTDGFRPYLEAVDDAFGADIDYAMLVKMYGSTPEAETRYSPAKCIGASQTRIAGKPETDNVSTSHIERQNLTMRMGMRRFTRLTNGFSKKVENMQHAVALHFMHYNFVRIHTTLKVTPAMEAGVTDRLWSLEDIVDLLEEQEAKAA